MDCGAVCDRQSAPAPPTAAHLIVRRPVSRAGVTGDAQRNQNPHWRSGHFDRYGLPTCPIYASLDLLVDRGGSNVHYLPWGFLDRDRSSFQAL